MSRILCKKFYVFFHLCILTMIHKKTKGDLNEKHKLEILKYYLYNYVEDRSCLLIQSKFEVNPGSNIVKTGAFHLEMYNEILLR